MERAFLIAVLLSLIASLLFIIASLLFIIVVLLFIIASLLSIAGFQSPAFRVPLILPCKARKGQWMAFIPFL
jgi:hypothetical protein